MTTATAAEAAKEKTIAATMARTVDEASVPTRVISTYQNHHQASSSQLEQQQHQLPANYENNHNHETTANHPIDGSSITSVPENQHMEIPSSSSSFAITIRLDPHEEELFETLLQVADTWEREQQHDGLKLQQPQHQHTTASTTTTTAGFPSLQLRVAGGWVRDKVLGLPRANDVDITVDLMSGLEFATLVQQHYHDHHAHPDMTCSSKIGIVAANPDQSKHLETATMRFHFDYTHRRDEFTMTRMNYHDHEDDDYYYYNQEVILDVDFCQLRSQEVYEEHSRIPTVTIGTAWEDAQRRDFTMNALFWNLRTRQIEDWTRRGLVDLLHTKTLETPLAPDVTLVEDPLRALRAVRFAVRFGMTLDPALRLAILRRDLHVALERKISRERVGKELEGMTTGKDAKPVQALELLIDLELASSVFCWVAPNFTALSPSPSPPPPSVNHNPGNNINNNNNISRFEGTLLGQSFAVDELTMSSIAPLQRQAWEESRMLLRFIPPLLNAYQSAEEQVQALTAAIPNNNMFSIINNNSSPSCFTKLDARLFHLAVFLLPFRHITVDALVKKKRLKRPLVAYFLHESVKFKNKDVQGMTTIMDNVSAMLQLLDDVASTNTTLQQQQQQSKHVNQNKHQAANAAASLCRAKAGLLLRTTKDSWVTCLWVAMVLKLHAASLPSSSSSSAINWLQIGLNAHQMIMVDLHLDQVWKVKPLLDGDAVIQALSLPRGPLVGKYLEEQVMWMLLHPQGSKQECQEHLLSVKRRMLGEAGVDTDDDDDDNRNDESFLNNNNTRQPSERHISKKFHGDESESTSKR